MTPSARVCQPAHWSGAHPCIRRSQPVIACLARHLVGELHRGTQVGQRRAPADQRPRRTPAPHDPRGVLATSVRTLPLPRLHRPQAPPQRVRHLLQPPPRAHRTNHRRQSPCRARLRCPQDGAPMSRTCRHNPESVQANRPLAPQGTAETDIACEAQERRRRAPSRSSPRRGRNTQAWSSAPPRRSHGAPQAASTTADRPSWSTAVLQRSQLRTWACMRRATTGPSMSEGVYPSA